MASPEASTYFFLQSALFIHTCFAFLPPLALKGYKILGMQGYCDSSRMRGAVPWDGFGYAHPFRREWHTGVNFKNLSDWPIMPYSKVLTTWLEWPILGWRHSYLQRTVNHWMVGGAWKQPVDNSEFQWMLSCWFACYGTRTKPTELSRSSLS